VLADVLPTDRARLRPLIPDSPATLTLRQACRARKDLVGHRVAVGNQLRAHLLCAFPEPRACSAGSTRAAAPARPTSSSG